MSVLKYKDGEVWKEAPIAITAGMNGKDGKDGKSAYQIAVENGFEGSETEWLASLKGADGRNGIDGINGTNGTNGKDGKDGKDGKTPVKGVDYFTQAEIQQIENNAAAKVDLSDYAKTADLSTVATSGSYEDLTNKPTIPAAYELPVASATTLGGVKIGNGLSITNGVLSATGGGVADSVDWDKVQNKPNFANVATSGDYNDLINQPIIPSIAGLASEAYVNEKVAAIKVPSLDGYAKTADLSTVATSGSYNDLVNKPTIPNIEGLASITYVDTKVAAIKVPTVPTKVSAFTNDAGYLTEHQDLTSYAKKTEIPNVPTNISAFNNDVGYLTEHQSLSEYAKKSEIPAPYTLPVATRTTLGGVKIGAGLAMNDGVLSATGGGTADSVDWGNIENKPSFSTVATSGSYNDLLDKPSIPSTAGLASTEYVDSKVGEIVIPTVPTKVSAFENDKGYLTEHQSLADYVKSAQLGTAAYTDSTAYDENGAAAAALINAKEYADSKDVDIATAKQAGIDAKNAAAAINTKLGTIPEDKTIAEMITDAQTAATYDDTAIKASIKANTDAITTLNADEKTNGSIKKQVADAVAKIVADAPEAYDTLVEIADWISTHSNDASAMNTAITKLQGILTGIGGEGEKATVKAYVDDMIAALKIGDYVKASTLATVATSGNYNDLSNKPAIPSIDGLASEAYVNTKLAALKIPEVPTKISAFTNDVGYLKEHQSLVGYAKSADLKTVAKTGSYNDLIDKPTIPSTTGLATEKYVDNKVSAIVIPTVPTKVSAFENDKGYLTEHQSLDLYAKKSEIPTIPTKISDFENDVGYLTAHQSLAEYAKKTEIPTVPTKVSAFTNDAGYLTEHQDLTSYAKKTDIPTVPTKVSAFENDAGYLTTHQSLTEYAKKTEIPTVPTKVSAFENDKGYLTSHQSLAAYSTTAQVQTMINNAIGAIENGTY